MTNSGLRYSVTLGTDTIARLQGIDASLPSAIAGAIVVAAGYSAAFISLGALAAAGLVMFWIGKPETRDATREPAINEEPGAKAPPLAGGS